VKAVLDDQCSKLSTIASTKMTLCTPSHDKYVLYDNMKSHGGKLSAFTAFPDILGISVRDLPVPCSTHVYIFTDNKHLDTE
jgi:hypothetical protein